jgi:hypothetical protein
MLEGLDKIDWKKLEHAYGEASDVPQLIRNLASKDPDLRDQALYELYGNIFHQGTRYQATPYAIPFFFELIRQPDTPDKADLIKFTVDLALGYPEAYLPKGPNVEDWVIDAEQLKEEAQSEELGDIEEDWLKHIDSFIDSYKATLKEISTYYTCLESKDLDIKIMAIFAIAWFREEAKTSIIKMRNLIKKISDEKIIANSLISLSMLGSYLEDKNDEQLFRTYLTESSSLLVKFSAAIALVNILEEEVDSAPIDYILKEIPTIVDLNLSPYEFPWNDGELLGYISEVIKFCAVQAPEKVVPDLTKVVSKLKGIKALNVIYSLLWIVFPELPEQGSWTLKLLNKFQKMVLKVLAQNSELWKEEDIESADLIELLKEYRLPTSQAGLKKLLQLDFK